MPASSSARCCTVLTKAGCNQGACHGAQHGPRGFRLSLLGFDRRSIIRKIVQSAERAARRRVRPGAQHPITEADADGWNTAAASGSR